MLETHQHLPQDMLQIGPRYEYTKWLVNMACDPGWTREEQL